jgi:hypothetical protein
MRARARQPALHRHEECTMAVGVKRRLSIELRVTRISVCQVVDHIYLVRVLRPGVDDTSRALGATEFGSGPRVHTKDSR